LAFLFLGVGAREEGEDWSTLIVMDEEEADEVAFPFRAVEAREEGEEEADEVAEQDAGDKKTVAHGAGNSRWTKISMLLAKQYCGFWFFELKKKRAFGWDALG
jgi:hypothetical protein